MKSVFLTALGAVEALSTRQRAKALAIERVAHSRRTHMRPSLERASRRSFSRGIGARAMPGKSSHQRREDSQRLLP